MVQCLRRASYNQVLAFSYVVLQITGYLVVPYIANSLFKGIQVRFRLLSQCSKNEINKTHVNMTTNQSTPNVIKTSPRMMYNIQQIRTVCYPLLLNEVLTLDMWRQPSAPLTSVSLKDGIFSFPYLKHFYIFVDSIKVNCNKPDFNS